MQREAKVSMSLTLALRQRVCTELTGANQPVSREEEHVERKDAHHHHHVHLVAIVTAETDVVAHVAELGEVTDGAGGHQLRDRAPHQTKRTRSDRMIRETVRNEYGS